MLTPKGVVSTKYKTVTVGQEPEAVLKTLLQSCQQKTKI